MKLRTLQFSIFSTLFVFFFSVRNLHAQVPLTLPQASQEATISQTIGLTDITINYHRPGVKDRVIWGKLVPYNVVWRAGANKIQLFLSAIPLKLAGKICPPALTVFT